MLDGNEYIATFLKKARKNSGLTAKEVSERLEELGIKLSGVTINGYENGRSIPDATKFLALCSVYDIDNPLISIADPYGIEDPFWSDPLYMGEPGYFVDDPNETTIYVESSLSIEERRLLENYNKLSPFNRETIDILMDRLVREPELMDNAVRYLSHPVHTMPASAGPGTFLDSDNYDLVNFPEDVVPRDSNFAVRVSGDSMEPDFKNGSIVFIKQTKDISPGEVGLFILNNEGFLKIVGDSNNLISINPKYKDIKVGEYDDFRVVGKVVGKPYVEE